MNDREQKFRENLAKLHEQLEGLDKSREIIGMTAEECSAEISVINEWLKDNKRIVALIELIPKAKQAEGELAYITLGQYRKHWGREPKESILTKDGKRVRWEYALDELAQELGLERQYGEKADEALRDIITMAVDYKERRQELEHTLSVRQEEYKKSGGDIVDLSVNIGRREQVGDVLDERTEHAKAVDEGKQAEQVLNFPRVLPWLKSPARFDIRGLDTRRRQQRKRKPRRRISKSRVYKPIRPTLRGMR